MVSQYRYDLPIRPAVTALRVTFGVILIAALISGYVGFGQLLGWSTGKLDLLYQMLQLFVLEADALQEDPDRIPLLLQIARFAAPAVTVYAFVEAGRLLFAAEWRRVRARHSRGHVVLCGEGAVANTLARRLQAAHERVVTVQSGRSDPQPRPTRLTVTGDARDPELLRAAGIGRATKVFACTENSAMNTAIAMAVSRVRGDDGPPITVHVYIRDPDLCLTLQARYLGVPHPPGVRLDFFAVDDLAARRLLSELEVAVERPPRMLVAGATAFGRAVAVEAARRWRMRGDGTALPMTVVDPGGTAAVAQLVHRYPFLRLVCAFDVYDAELLPVLATGVLREPPDLAFVCHDDEELALKTAVTAERLWHGQPRAIVVRLDRLATAGDRPVREAADGSLFDDLAGPLRVFGAVHAACDPRTIGDDLVERLARVVHDRYRLARDRQGDAGNGSMASWDDLAPELRESNREQARDIGRKLRAVDCALVPRMLDDGDVSLNDDDVELLARMEHDRWRAERGSRGWRFAEHRDQARRLHPGLCEWEDLAEPLRYRSRESIREMVAILADAGFQIVRSEPAPVRVGEV